MVGFTGLTPSTLHQPGRGRHPRGASHRGDGDTGAGRNEDGAEEGHREEAAYRGDSG